jgi:hypothetical protein
VVQNLFPLATAQAGGGFSSPACDLVTWPCARADDGQTGTDQRVYDRSVLVWVLSLLVWVVLLSESVVHTATPMTLHNII